MKWTVLGFQSPYPGPQGATPGYLLQTSLGNLLIDCGSGVAAQLAAYAYPWELQAIVLSHLHHDHMVDIPIIHYAMMMAHRQKKRLTPLPIYAPSTPKEMAERLVYQSYVEPRPIEEQTPIAQAGITIEWVRTQHDIECYGMKVTDGVKTILYTADTGPQTNWGDYSPDLLIVEGTYLHKDTPAEPRGHLSVKEAATLATKIGAKKCIITHLYPLYDRNELLQEAKHHYHGELYLAEVGLEVEI
jgi:ribonuclease BN (tRNA processing enzyme)